MNVVESQIEFVEEELERISLKDASVKEDNQAKEQIIAVQGEQHEKPNHFQKIGDVLQVTPRSS